jgi:hypothetical protein
MTKKDERPTFTDKMWKRTEFSEKPLFLGVNAEQEQGGLFPKRLSDPVHGPN